MSERTDNWTTDAFEQSRPRLRAVAYRMLGSRADADDAVQEAWLRLRRADPERIENFQGWLTTVVARICLDTLRARRPAVRGTSGAPGTRATSATAARGADPLEVPSPPGDEPDHDVLLADSIGPALMVVLERLTPAERLAFVLHDLFAVPFDEIAPVVGRSPAATRQLASRARRRVRGHAPAGPSTTTAAGEQDAGEQDAEEKAAGEETAGDGAARADLAARRERQRQVVEAFLAAARGGNFEGLVAVLDPDVVVQVDPVAVELAARARRGARRLPSELRGAEVAARTFAGWARGARPALVGGLPGAVWAPGGRVRSAFCFEVRDGKVVSIEVVADPDRIAALEPRL